MGSQLAKLRPEATIARLATPQGGVVSRRQLVSAGLSVAAIDKRVNRGLLRMVHRGVYATAHARLTRTGLWHAAVLAQGPSAALGGRDAGAHWKLLRAPTGPVCVIVPGRAGRSRRRGISLHRAPLAPGDVFVRDGLRVTSPARTLVDLAACLGDRELERALDEAHYLNRVSPRTLAETVARNRRRPGVGALRALLADHELGTTRTESALEERFLQAIRAAGLPDPRCQEWIGPYRVDFLWPADRVIAEVDGPAHRRRRRQADDAVRDRYLEDRDYRVVRIDEAEVEARPEAAVRRVLSARRPSPAG